MCNRKMVIFNEIAKQPLIKGVNLIADAVQTTFGPNGKNVIIKNKSGIHITKDGATVAQYVDSDNEFVQMGVDVVKQIALKTAKDVGDGTTTSIILARELVNSLKDSEENPIEIQRGLQKECSQVIKKLETLKKEISSYDDLLKVSVLSANNDPKLGKLIADAYNKVGKEGVVNMEESDAVEDSIVYTEGMELESGYLSPYFINMDNNTCELENVYVYISEFEITPDDKEIIKAANHAIQNKNQLLVIAPKIDSNIIRMFMTNNMQGVLKSCCIISPNHKIYRDIILNDIRNMLGENMVCNKVIVGKETTVLLGCSPIKEKVDEEVKSIRNKLNSNSLSEFEIKFHKKRLANYVGGIATIKIGGYSKIEILEKKDRVEDAICAVKAALDGGILPGGGAALVYCVSPDFKYLTGILTKPFDLLSNGEYRLNPNNSWEGWNFKTREYGDMLKLGVIDPFYVTKIALENSISVASLILTNECSILNMK